jgi:hypothetical protein
MAREGMAPLLKKSRSLLLKRQENLKADQRFRLRDLLRLTSGPSALTFQKKRFNSSGITTPRRWRASFSLTNSPFITHLANCQNPNLPTICSDEPLFSATRAVD